MRLSAPVSASDDLLAWQLRSGRRYGLVFPNYKGEPWRETDWGNWTVRVWGPLREALGVSEPPYGLRHSYASLRIREGASIPELGGGARPQSTDDARHLRARDPRTALPAEQEISRARQELAEQGLERLGAEAIR